MQRIILSTILLALSTAVFAEKVTVQMYQTTKAGTGKKLGTIEFVDTKKGLLIEPQLQGLTPGAHGFHIHLKPSCKNKGLAAGGHYDPTQTHQHLGPYNKKGHRGDLPQLMVDKQGETNEPLLAPNLTVQDLKGRAVIIHENGDNYSDKPEKLGGGGARIACGVITD